MDRKLINPAIVQDIAAAIREKGGQTEPIVVNALGDAIRALPQGMGDNTTEVVEAISGEQPSGDIEIANAIAKGATDAAREHVWQGSRATDNGREVKDGVAFVSSLKGRSFKMSQNALDDRNTSVSKGVTLSLRNGVFTAEGTRDSAGEIILNIGRTTGGHMYLCTFNGESGGVNVIAVQFYSSQETKRGYNGSNIVIPSYDANIYAQVGQGRGAGDVYNIRCIIRVFDLTAMGMEDVVDADDFAHRLGYADAASLPYIPYGEQIINSKPTKVVSRGRNLWDEEWEVGTINSLGLDEPYATRIRSSYIPVIGGKSYYYTQGFSSNAGRAAYYDADKKFISYVADFAPKSKPIFTPPSGAVYLRFSANVSYGPVYRNDICINVSDDMNGTYTPYMQPSVLPLPLSSILHEGQPLFPNGLCGIGDVKDEVDWAKGKATKRIGVVDLGTLTWDLNNTYGFYAIFLNLAFSGSSIIPFILCSQYKTFTGTSIGLLGDKEVCGCVGFINKGVVSINVKDSAYSSGTAFKTAMQGVLLFYKLADPIEVTFDPCKAFYKVQNGGSEEAVMDGVSAPLVADIAYRDNMAYAEEAALLAFANERSGQNDADLGDAIRTLSE